MSSVCGSSVAFNKGKAAEKQDNQVSGFKRDWEGTRACVCLWECVRHVPVALHFHLSSERMALAGARNAKALAWNNGSLKAKHTQKHNHSQKTVCTDTPTTLLLLGNIYVWLRRKDRQWSPRGALNHIMESVTKSFRLWICL